MPSSFHVRQHDLWRLIAPFALVPFLMVFAGSFFNAVVAAFLRLEQ